MKKYITFFLSAMMPAWLFAEPVDSLLAKQVATTFFTEQSGAKSASMGNDYSCQKYGNIYAVNNADGGWVLVSADDCVRPILAYSPDGKFSLDNVSPATKAWFDNYNEQITIAQTIELQSEGEAAREWKQLKNGKTRSKSAEFVEPLVKTKWNQSPLYNNDCPEINGEKAVTGCVATAMAQVMNYWQWPKHGYGFHEYKSQNCGTLATLFGMEYEWNYMPEQLDNSSPEEYVDAVADLMSDCGISVDMNYDVASNGGSGAYPQKVKNAMVRYFKYSPDMTLEQKDNYAEDEWIAKLKNELNNNRPILYYGCGGGSGHAFVCDGYDVNDYFHFNWGWNGRGDAYYYINELTPKENGIGATITGTYSNNQQAYFGVKPSNDKQDYNLRMYDNSLLAFDEDGNQSNMFKLGTDTYYRAKIENYGDTDFSGTFAVAVFDYSDRFVNISNEVHIDLPANSYTSEEIEFKIDRSLSYVTYKDYLAALVYKDALSEDWVLVSHNSNLLNVFAFSVDYWAPISVNSEILVFDTLNRKVTNQEFIQDDIYTCTISVINNGTEDYTGYFVLSLTDTKGVSAQNIGRYQLEQPLKPDSALTINFIDSIKVESGSYILTLGYAEGESSSEEVELLSLAGSVNGGVNPVFFDVKAEYLPDEYEDNNNIENAYVFTLDYSNDRAHILTLRKDNDGYHYANLNRYDDIDYYKFDLTQGYDYYIYATLYNNKDEAAQTTADDVTVEYSYDGENWFEGHDYEYRFSKNFSDSDRNDKLIVNSGGSVYVRISHPWGKKGTYIFDADVIRTANNSSQEETNVSSIENVQTEISVCPNPATDYLTISSSDCYTINNVVIYDCQGRKVLSSNNPQINVSRLNNGIYIVEIQTNRGVIKRKISKQ